jgi:hypothetical protein
MFNYWHPPSPPVRAFRMLGLFAALKYVTALEAGMTDNQQAELLKKICGHNQALIEQTCIILLACAKGRHDAH